MGNRKPDRYHSKADEYIKRYGKRPCAEWYMRVSLDRNYYRLSEKIELARKVLKKEMAILVATSIAINMISSLLLHKWK